MSQKVQDVFNGKTPYSWQLDTAEAIILGLDCVVFAGTGARKTIPFMLPLFVHDSQDKLVIIISSLNASGNWAGEVLIHSFVLCIY